MSNESSEMQFAKFMDAINRNLGGGGTNSSHIDPIKIEEDIERYAQNAFMDVKRAIEEVGGSIETVAKRVAEEFENILGFRSGAARSVKVTLINVSPFHLVKVGEGLSHGIWMKEESSPNIISPGETVVFGSESSGLFTGTEGWAKYRLCGDFESSGSQDLGISFQLNWDNPFSGSNSCSHSWPDGNGENPLWNTVSLKDPAIHGDNAEIEWVFNYYGK